MSDQEKSRPTNQAAHKFSLAGDGDLSLTDGTFNLQEHDALPFGDSLYADVPDMGDFIRLTIRNAAAHIDVKKHRAAVKV